jgi:hypothetical protein
MMDHSLHVETWSLSQMGVNVSQSELKKSHVKMRPFEHNDVRLIQ